MLGFLAILAIHNRSHIVTEATHAQELFIQMLICVKVHWAKNLLSYNIWSQALLKETTMSDFMDWNLESEVVEIVCLECLVASVFLQMNIICHFGLCR